MRVYHFLAEKWGLESLKLSRLKLALFEDMNDPFELLGAMVQDANDQVTYSQLKAELHNVLGVFCFSRKWSNPVLWSHYAEKHRGLCLGFDIPDKWVKEVKYRKTRLRPEPENFQPSNDKETFGYKLLTTKFSHWKYEDEVRLVVKLEDAQNEEDKYFLPYCEALKLREVIIGSRSDLLIDQILDIVPPGRGKVSVYHAGLSCHSYKIVRSRRRGTTNSGAHAATESKWTL